MKILHVTDSMNPKLGGTCEAIRQISYVLNSDGHQIEIVTIDSPSETWLSNSAWPVHALGPGLGTFGYSRLLSSWIESRAKDFDCVLLHGVWQYPCLAAWKSLRGSNTPYFLYTHGMLDPWFQKNHPFKHIKKSIYWRLVGHRVLSDARAVLFTCEEERILASRSFRPYRCKSATLHLGTSGPEGNPDDHQRALREYLPELDGRRFLLFLGRIHPKKGCDLLLEAFATVAKSEPDLLLVIAGPDQLGWSRALVARALELGIDHRVLWPGMLSGDLKWGVFRAAEAFCLPSHQENFGLAVVEAMSCGVPVLISNKVNIWREIEADEAGIIDEDDLAGTVRCLARWLGSPASQRENMKKKALACFTSNFHIDKAGQCLVKVLRDHGVPNTSRGNL